MSYENRWSLLDAASSADTDLIDKIKSIATRLFVAFEAEGYARIDLRQDRLDGRLHVLDINPNCSVFYRDSCTADSIVEQDGCGKQHLMHHMIAQAWRRSARSRASNKSQVRYHPKRGFSLHAACDIKQDDVVYSDEMGMLRVVTRDFADKHWSAAEMSDFDRYAWPIGPQTFAIWSPDARDWKPINHSCDPNCWMHGLETRARRDIAQGDELTLDYSVFEPYHPPFQCWCGAAQCEGVIKPNRHTDPAFVAKYAGHCSPFMEHLIADHVQKCGLD
jgi:D-alanine-D-alanine ligase